MTDLAPGVAVLITSHYLLASGADHYGFAGRVESDPTPDPLDGDVLVFVEPLVGVYTDTSPAYGYKIPYYSAELEILRDR